jgi:hypothetical protein
VRHPDALRLAGKGLIGGEFRCCGGFTGHPVKSLIVLHVGTYSNLESHNKVTRQGLALPIENFIVSLSSIDQSTILSLLYFLVIANLMAQPGKMGAVLQERPYYLSEAASTLMCKR